MNPARLQACLAIIRWPPETLAEALGCEPAVVHLWLEEIMEIPLDAGSWVEVLATAHVAAETLKPKLAMAKHGRK